MQCLVLLRKMMFGNRVGFDATTYTILLSTIVTFLMRNVNPTDYMVQILHSSIKITQRPTDLK